MNRFDLLYVDWDKTIAKFFASVISLTQPASFVGREL